MARTSSLLTSNGRISHHWTSCSQRPRILMRATSLPHASLLIVGRSSSPRGASGHSKNSAPSWQKSRTRSRSVRCVPHVSRVASDSAETSCLWTSQREKWRRRESNPRPKTLSRNVYVCSPWNDTPARSRDKTQSGSSATKGLFLVPWSARRAQPQDYPRLNTPEETP